MRLHDFDVLSFDCYGTLIDWETGLLAALAPLLDRVATPPTREGALEAFGRLEHAQQVATPTKPYRDILAIVYKRLAEAWERPATWEQAQAFGASIPFWPAFPDSAAALAELKQRYRLVILSNVDNASFAASNAKLGVTFDAVFTAEETGVYKPDRRGFDYMLARLGERKASARTRSCTRRRACSTIIPPPPRSGWRAASSTGTPRAPAPARRHCPKAWAHPRSGSTAWRRWPPPSATRRHRAPRKPGVHHAARRRGGVKHVASACGDDRRLPAQGRSHVARASLRSSLRARGPRRAASGRGALAAAAAGPRPRRAAARPPVADGRRARRARRLDGGAANRFVLIVNPAGW